MITKADGEIDWTKDAVTLERLIRGLNPWPSAFTHLEGKTLKIWKASVRELDSKETAGTVISSGKDGLIVQTGQGQLQILELLLEGKKRMEIDAFLRGYSVQEGTVLA